MSYIELENHEWFCNNDLLLICEREKSFDENPFMNDNQLQIRRRFIPKVNFNDEKLFPSKLKSLNKIVDDELKSELNSLLACKEYVRKQNPFYNRKQTRNDDENKSSSTRKKLSRFHD